MNKYTGIDVSKSTFDCSISQEDGKIRFKKFSNNQVGFEQFLSHLPFQSHVVMEASGPYYLKLATYLYNQGITVCVINPLIIRRFCQMRMIRTKTDKKDAGMIREYGLTEQPACWKPDEPNITKLKQLNSLIELMDKSITALKNQLGSFLEMPDTDQYLIKTLKDLIKIKSGMKDELEREMEQVALKFYKQTYMALKSIPGIGPKSAAMLIAISGNFKKFSNYKQLIAYVGLNPRIYESGTSVKGKGHISKMGTARLRKLLYLCSWSAKRCNIYCKELYERLKAKAKPERVIKIAIANKLLRQAFGVGTSLVFFEKNYQKIVAN